MRRRKSRCTLRGVVEARRTQKARREASGRMGQIGILARMSRRTVATASRQRRDKARHHRVRLIWDATVVARGKARKHGRSVECDDSLDRSLALQINQFWLTVVFGDTAITSSWAASAPRAAKGGPPAMVGGEPTGGKYPTRRPSPSPSGRAIFLYSQWLEGRPALSFDVGSRRSGAARRSGMACIETRWS